MGVKVMIPEFIICGVEHSGTTLLSDIFRQVPNLDAGFEVGVLLCKTPKEFRNFEPYATQLLEGWGLKKEDLDYICDTYSFEEFYERLYERSTILKKPCKIFDKTPRYAWGLQECLNKYNGKYICTYKDPRALVWSNYKRYKGKKDWDEWFEEFIPKLKKYWKRIYSNYNKVRQRKLGNSNIFIVSLEELTLNTRNTIENIFEFVGIPFKLDYLLLKNLRYPHTRADYISVKVTFEYKYYLSRNQIRQIEEELSEFKEWFYE